jgi:hypothetical protein
MTELEIKQKLDTLAEYQSHRDLLDADKRNLLEEVKVPDEVQAIVSAGMKQIGEVEMSFIPLLKEYEEEADAQLMKIVIPDEIKTALMELDRKRKAVQDEQQAKNADVRAKIQAAKATIQTEVDAATQGVYTALAARKAEIDAEFAGKAEAVDENIRKLTKDIKAAVSTFGLTVKGSFLMATFGEGRKTWFPKRLDKYVETHPDIQECYTTGDPVITIRKI